MPITIGKKIESDYSNPLGLLSDCHRRIEQFLDVLMRVTSHFQAEEEILFPAMSELSGAPRIIDELLAEHERMRRLIDLLRQIELSCLASTLKEFADTLEAHIRKEERELFPIYEQQASPETIFRVERAIFSLIGSASQPRNPELLR